MENFSSNLFGKAESFRENKISISSFRPASLFEWNAIWRVCDYSTYFHSSEWAEIWSAYKRGKMFLTPFLVLFSDDKKALLPFSCLIKKGLAPILMGTSRLYISSPECTYGGWISADKLSNSHAILLSNIVKKKFNNLSWRLNPYDNNAFKSGIRISDEDETHAINLEKGFDVIASNMSGGHRRAIKHAIRNGVTVRLSASIEDWREYYQVYEASVNRWGNRLVGDKYSWELFNEIFKRNSPNIELWLATYRDRIISGAICFHSKRHFVAWCGGSLETYFNLRPVNLLLYEVIKNACEKGYTWFDFNPSAKLKGVEAFKENFGAKALRAPVVWLSPRNMRVSAIEKVNSMFIEFKNRSKWALPTPLGARARKLLQII